MTNFLVPSWLVSVRSAVLEFLAPDQPGPVICVCLDSA